MIQNSLEYSYRLYDKLVNELKLNKVLIQFCYHYNITPNNFPYDSLELFMSNPFEVILGYFVLFIEQHNIHYKYDSNTYICYNNTTIKQEQINNLYDMYFKHIVYSLYIINNNIK